MNGRYTDPEIIAAVQSSLSIAQVLKRLGLSPTGANSVSYTHLTLPTKA